MQGYFSRIVIYFKWYIRKNNQKMFTSMSLSSLYGTNLTTPNFFIEYVFHDPFERHIPLGILIGHYTNQYFVDIGQ